MKDIDNLRPRGRLILDIFKRGELIEHYDGENLVVDVSKKIKAHLIAGDVTGYSVTKIGFGTNGSAPVAANAQLADAFLKNIAAYSFPTETSIKFDFTLASNENNGMSIREFGLLTTSGLLYARKARSSALLKTSDISLSGSWVITF